VLIAVRTEVVSPVADAADDRAQFGLTEEPAGQEAGGADPAAAQGVEDRLDTLGVPVAREDQGEPLPVARPTDDGPAIEPGARPVSVAALDGDGNGVSPGRDACDHSEPRHPGTSIQDRSHAIASTCPCQLRPLRV
jgi:hypothetical protein